jgi:hypothetical protein
MKNGPWHVGSCQIKPPSGQVAGEYVSIGPQRFYRINNFDRMEPFFMSLVSASNHWMFISSEGGLTAGRQNSDRALFPYVTEDKIHDGSDHTGSRTILRVEKDGRHFVWEPFSRRCRVLYDLSRSLAKDVEGTTLVFEEVNIELDLVFRTAWMLSDAFGFVKRSEIENTGGEPATVEVLDGIENILPWGVDEYFQNHYSCLGDAYKQNEIEPETGLGIFALSSIPGDSAEPAEALRATVCWSTCAPASTRLLSSLQLDAFRHGAEVQPERRVCGRRGAYFVRETRRLAAGERRHWLIVADVDYGPSEIASLKRTLANTEDVGGLVLQDVRHGTQRLRDLVARADGLQQTGDALASAHHFSNVLFNVMRGGLFESSYTIDMEDLKAFIRSFNSDTFARHERWLGSFGEACERDRLMAGASTAGDPDLLRLVTEYLPLSFSRRHGDPSRPWNRFSINVKNRDGSRRLDYEGNWRDIFQNWEALCLSFPEYLEGVINKFVNTTTADGFNPYRVTRDGYDWEAPNPDEPWANLGYWGDHQLIYLLKLLELTRRHHPGKLEALLADRRFVYADVPYDIKPYEELLADPRQSISYNPEGEQRIADRVQARGYDGRYLTDPSGTICRATLAEKLLVPLLAKICCFVPGAGFWMNTQRPEWNDANNALAGYGVSMVTLCYARRYVAFCRELLAGFAGQSLELSAEVAGWLQGVVEVLESHRRLLEASDIGDRERKSLLDELGRVTDTYRSALYTDGLSGRREAITGDEVLGLLDVTLEFFDQTIQLNARDDGLYHAYNVLGISHSGLSVSRLQAMLEGQVAVLSSGALSPSESLSVLDALRHSEMYRGDQHTYLLYPNRALPSFLEKNTVPSAAVERSQLINRLLSDANNDLVEQDIDGKVHFNGLFRNIRDVQTTLDELAQRGYGRLVDEERELVCEIFESVFDHSTFTGRSGAFYGYEGLGCIYWHMVSKLLLAVQECCLAAASSDDEAFAELARRYYDVRAGLGFNKSPDEYGAFPTDPYSHTPGFAGAKQPGMTGQVKEEIITRLGEFGLAVEDGRIRFRPLLLRPNEFLSAPEAFEYVAVDGTQQSLELDRGNLAFTYCQVPIVYRLAEHESVTLYGSDGSTRKLEETVLDRETSHEIFRRTGRIVRLDVHIRRVLQS